jgi:hypothetical protein
MKGREHPERLFARRRAVSLFCLLFSMIFEFGNVFFSARSSAETALVSEPEILKKHCNQESRGTQQS